MNTDYYAALEDLKDVSAARRWAKNGTARRIRDLSEVTQAEIAEVVGVDASTVSLWETGQRTPSGDAAKAYARALAALGAQIPGGIQGVERQVTADSAEPDGQMTDTTEPRPTTRVAADTHVA